MARNFVFKQIPKDDVNTTPFHTFKRWGFSDSDYSSSYGITVKRGLAPNIQQQYRGNSFPANHAFADNSEEFNPDGTYQKIEWFSLRNLYYRNSTFTFGTEDPKYTDKQLYATASVMSIPTIMYGERIKANSILINDNSQGALLSDSTQSLSHGTEGTARQYSDWGSLSGYNNEAASESINNMQVGEGVLSSQNWNTTSLPYSLSGSGTTAGFGGDDSNGIELFDWGFSIPTGATIDNVFVYITHRTSHAQSGRRVYGPFVQLQMSSSTTPKLFNEGNTIQNYPSYAIPTVNQTYIVEYNENDSYNYNSYIPPDTNMDWFTAEDINDEGFGVNISNVTFRNTVGGLLTYYIENVTIEVHYTDTSGDNGIQIKDDGFGNLYDTEIPTGSMVDTDGLLGYWGYNKEYIHNEQKVLSKGTEDFSFLKNHMSYENVTFLPGIQTTGLQTLPSGYNATFQGDGQMWLDKADEFNIKHDQNFAVSLWVNRATNQLNVTEDVNWLVSKQGQTIETRIDKNDKLTEYYENYNQQLDFRKQFPFAVQVYNQNTVNDGKIRVARSDGDKMPFIVSTSPITANTDHHVVFNKTGSRMELWIDGVLDQWTLDTTSKNTQNRAILNLGCNGIDNNTGYSGSLDEVRIYRKGLSPAEIVSLSDNDFDKGTAFNTPKIGNVFYRNGVMVVSDPRPKYKNVLTGKPRTSRTGSFTYENGLIDYGFNVNFRSTQTIYEHEILCQINEGEFNFSANPTIRQYNSLESDEIKGFTTHSEWNPYVTTIGLYDDYGRLLVVGKTAQPIPLRSDVKSTFIVRYDQ